MWWAAVLVIAAVAGFIVTSSVSKASAAATRYDGVTTAYVARHALTPGHVIEASDVQPQSRPRAFIPEKAVTSDPTGQVVDVPIASGDVVTELNTGKTGLSPTAALLNKGEQGVAIAQNDSSPSFQVGDNVTVIATPQPSDTTGAVALVVTDHARVVNVTEHAVTIAVNASDAPRVAFAQARSSVTLAITTP